MVKTKDVIYLWDRSQKYYGKVLHSTNQRQTELNVSMITFHAKISMWQRAYLQLVKDVYIVFIYESGQSQIHIFVTMNSLS